MDNQPWPQQTRSMGSFLLGDWILGRIHCRIVEQLLSLLPLLFNVTRDLNTTELIFEENRNYCNNRGCNMVTNESYCSPLHFEFLG